MTVIHTKAVTPNTDPTVAAMIAVLETPFSFATGLVIAWGLEDAVELGADVTGAIETEEVEVVTDEEEVDVVDFMGLVAVEVALTMAGRA
jgi:hypothetical protein